jgi:hypothetical protein
VAHSILRSPRGNLAEGSRLRSSKRSGSVLMTTSVQGTDGSWLLPEEELDTFPNE